MKRICKIISPFILHTDDPPSTLVLAIATALSAGLLCAAVLLVAHASCEATTLNHIRMQIPTCQQTRAVPHVR